MADNGAHLAVVILAAGGSTRLGTPKQDVLLAGKSLLMRAVDYALGLRTETCLAACDVHVISGANHANDARALAGSGAHLHYNAAWAGGQASSFVSGIRAAGDADGALIMLVDQYRLGYDDLRAIVTRWCVDRDRIVAAAYADTLGVPVVWPARLFASLRAAGQSGREHLRGQDVEAVDIADAAYDIDTPHDLSVMRSWEREAASRLS